MKNLDYIKGNGAMTLEKLAAIRGDLVRTDPIGNLGTLLSYAKPCTNG